MFSLLGKFCLVLLLKGSLFGHRLALPLGFLVLMHLDFCSKMGAGPIIHSRVSKLTCVDPLMNNQDLVVAQTIAAFLKSGVPVVHIGALLRFLGLNKGCRCTFHTLD